MKRFAPTLAAALLAALALAIPAQAAFGFKPGLEGFDVTFTDQNGSTDAQAGSHPFELSTDIALNSHLSELAGKPIEVPDGDVRDLIVAQMPGLVGNPTAVPRCQLVEFFAAISNHVCPKDTQLGTAEILIGINEGSGSQLQLPDDVYNLVPPPGVPQEIGFFAADAAPVIIDLGLSPISPYNAVATLRNIPSLLPFLGSKLTLWGVPAATAHNAARGGASGSPEVPWLTLPRSCRGPLAATTSYEADSWQDPGAFLPGGEPDLSDPAWISGSVENHDEAQPPSPQGLLACGKLGFGPTIAARPTTRAASSATGLEFSLDVADEGLLNPKEGATAASDIEKAVVTLPEGMTANPSLAEGLGVCTESQLAAESASSAPREGCPEASKIGTVEVETPLLEEDVDGALYIAKPYENLAGNSLIALYVVIKNKNLGIVVKQPLRVEPNTETGQLETIAEEIPQLPFSHFRLHFREGARSPLISPPRCGTYDGRNGDPEPVKATLYPYSGGAPTTTTSAFQILSGPNESPCPGPSAPFHPGFEAGSLNNNAGSYSPFYLHLTRKDGEQDMTKFSTVLPPGVVGKIAGLSWCPEAAIAQARGRTGPHGGQEELEHPSCPASSKIGRVLGGAGVGSQLTYVPGSLYLAGSYHGDPLSVVAIVPALAGPFDAGTVVVREALTLNPVTAEVEVDGSASDPIPHILKGIPLNVRDLRVYADRPEFTINPTSCDAETTRATLWGGGTVFTPSVETPVGLFARYEAANCAALGFKPKLAINLKGGTKRGKFPALKAIVTPRQGDANFQRAVVTLPHSAFLEQGHFGTICTRVQFAAPPGNGAQCPAASIYGKARAWTPLLSEPAEGPVYLRSSNHNLPDLVVALKGPPSAPFNVELDSRIDSKGGGIRSSFEAIPDIPVSKFILEMQGGKKGLIVNSTDLCVGKHKAKADITGQNGRLDRTETLVGAKCGKAKRHKAKRKRRAG